MLVSPKGGGLLLKPGFGKTAMMLAAFKLLRKAGLAKTMLVVAPLRVCQLVWPEQLVEWLDFSDLTFKLLHGPKKAQLAKEPADVYIVNYEGLRWLADMIYDKEVSYDILVLDESSKVRNMESQRYRLLKAILPRFKRRYILTGTPQPKSLLNLFGQVYAVDMGKTLGKFITHFRSEFFYRNEKTGEFELKNGARERIYDILKPSFFHLSDKKYLDLPDMQVSDILVELPKAAKEKYLQMEQEFETALKEGTIVAANSAVASGKCRQICNGALYTDRQGNYEVIHDEKLAAFQDLLEELNGEPAIIVYIYESDFIRMNKIAPGVKFTGAKDIVSVKEAWNRGEIERLYIHPDSAGYGLNMQFGGHNMIWFGMTWDMESYVQTIHRIYRQGQSHDVSIYRLIARGTLEHYVMRKRIALREESQAELFSALAEYWEKRHKGTLQEDGFEL